jgi:hypothetical protein
MDENTSQSASPKKSNSKMLIIIGVILVLLLLGGAGYFLMGKNMTKPASTSNTMEPKASPTTAGMFSSIKDALSKSISLQCDYSDETGRKTLAYIKAGTIRTDISGGKTAQENGSIIIKDKKMYFWSGKKGYTFEFDMTKMMQNAPKVSPSEKTPSTPGQSGSNMMQDLEKFKQYCKPAVVDDKLFVVPTDVTFTDMSKMIPSGAMMPKPSGTAAPTGMTQEQIQEMMKKYQQQPPSGQ